MTRLNKSFELQGAEPILLSVQPHFADLIANREKRVEIRRVAPARSIGAIAVYSSSPTKAIIALAEVTEVVEARPSGIWKIAQERGGGVTRAALNDYLHGRDTAFAILIGRVCVFDEPINPNRLFKKFVAPQSFRYLDANKFQLLQHFAKEQGVEWA
jgi:predicted transcriptional regulator